MAEPAPPRRTGTTTAPPPPSGRTAPPPTDDSKRRTAVKELLGIPLIPLGMLAAVETVKSTDENAISPYALDVYTLKMYEEPLADALVGLADAYPVLGALLDRVGTTTPFLALVGVGMSLAMQIAENHAALPDSMRSASPNLIPRQEMANQIFREAAERANGNGSAPE